MTDRIRIEQLFLRAKFDTLFRKYFRGLENQNKHKRGAVRRDKKVSTVMRKENIVFLLQYEIWVERNVKITFRYEICRVATNVFNVWKNKQISGLQ